MKNKNIFKALFAIFLRNFEAEPKNPQKKSGQKNVEIFHNRMKLLSKFWYADYEDKTLPEDRS